MRKVLVAAALSAIVAVGFQSVLPLRAQAPSADPAHPAFEVASVKTNKSVGQPVMAQVQPGGRFVATNITLRLLIRNAYRVQDRQISGEPSWVNSDRFDIQAKAEGNPSPEQFTSMVRSLLTDRFKLMVHNETRELPVYALVMARSDGRLGPQLRQTDCVVVLPDLRDPSQPQPCGTIRFGLGRLSVRGVPMPQMRQALSDLVARTVLDRTGLMGAFDLDLNWTPEQLPQRSLGAPELAPVDPNGPSIFTAVQEELGLKLESTKGPVDVLVIDHVERPISD